MRREKPDVRLYVLALLALAQQLQDEEQRAAQTAGSEGRDVAGEADHA